MLIFATSDADGAGRSVTSANLAYRSGWMRSSTSSSSI
jgi:hypothetical protein